MQACQNLAFRQKQPQNTLLELYRLVSMIDDRVFGDIDSFRAQFTSLGRNQAFDSLRARLAPVCLRTLRKQVQPYVSYTARKAIVQEFTPSGEEQELSRLVADYLPMASRRSSRVCALLWLVLYWRSGVSVRGTSSGNPR